MPSQDLGNKAITEMEQQLFAAIASKDLDKVKHIVKSNPKINLNCLDKDELTPLQHACHIGDVELARFLLDKGAGVDFTLRKDGYTPLMFAAISSKAGVVRLLLERGVDTSIENCVNRTAAQMAAFVGQSKIVAIINSWVPYESSVEPYTRCRELEDKPRVSSPALGRKLHDYIVYPSLHPVKLLLYIKENLELVKNATDFIYVLENLSSKSLKPQTNEESLSLKYYYLSYLIEYCLKTLKPKLSSRSESAVEEISSDELWDRHIESIIRKLIKREDPEEVKTCTKSLDHFVMECMLKFPYTHLAIFKTMTFALTKRESGDLVTLAILIQTLNGPRMFGQSAEACSICGETDKTKKCSKCKSVYYCGPSCQKADWFQHKKICKSPEEVPLLSGVDKA